MGQLQEVERFMQEGDVEKLSILLEELTKSTDFDMLYEAANLLAAYGYMSEADRHLQDFAFSFTR